MIHKSLLQIVSRAWNLRSGHDAAFLNGVLNDVRASSHSARELESGKPHTITPASLMEQPTISLVEHPFKLDGYIPRYPAGSKAPPFVDSGIFAVVEFSGTQYKVTDGDVIVADKLHDIDVGKIVHIDKVLMVGSKIATLIGRPIVLGAEVFAVVEEMAKDKKVITLKFRRRKNSKNIRGFRRQVTILRIKDIHVTAEHARDLGVQPPQR